MSQALSWSMDIKCLPGWPGSSQWTTNADLRLFGTSQNVAEQ